MKKTFGEFLKEKRLEKSLTQKELAGKLFVSESAVSKWEKGVARPDLSLIPEISKLLGVTEHELISASVDEKTRRQVKEAKSWRALTKTWEMFFIIAYAITILTCFIVNIAVDKTLSWFFIVLSSILLAASFTSLPKYIKKNKLYFVPLIELAFLILLFGVINITERGEWFLIATIPTLFAFILVFVPIWLKKAGFKHTAIVSVFIDYLALILTLLYICIYTDGKWFIDLGLILSTATFIIAVINVLIMRYLKLNKILKTGILLLVWNGLYIGLGFGVISIINNAKSIKIDKIQSYSPFRFNFTSWVGDGISNNILFLLFAVLIILGIIFLILGLKKEIKKIKKVSKNV